MRNFTELYRMDLPHRAISVYIYLADWANKDGIALFVQLHKRQCRRNGSIFHQTGISIVKRCAYAS